MERALEDPASADVGEKVRTTLVFLGKVTQTPGLVGPEDVAPMRAAGLSDEAIEEALHVATMFNIIVRLADAFEFELPNRENTKKEGAMLFKRGYKMGALPG